MEVNNLDNFKISKFYNRFFEILNLWLESGVSSENEENKNEAVDPELDSAESAALQKANKSACLILNIYFHHFSNLPASFFKHKTFNKILDKILRLKNPEYSLLVISEIFNKTYENVSILKFLSNHFSNLVSFHEDDKVKLKTLKLINLAVQEPISSNLSVQQNLISKIEFEQIFENLKPDKDSQKSLNQYQLEFETDDLAKESLKSAILYARLTDFNLKFCIEKMVGLAKFESANFPKNTKLRSLFMQFVCGIFIGNEKLIEQSGSYFEENKLENFSQDNEKNLEDSEDDELSIFSAVKLLLNPIIKEQNNTDPNQTSETLKNLTTKTIEFLKSKPVLGNIIFSKYYSQAEYQKINTKHETLVEQKINEKKNPELMIIRKKKRNEKVLKRRNMVGKMLRKQQFEKNKKLLKELSDI